MSLQLNLKTNEYGVKVLIVSLDNHENIECDISTFFKLPKDFNENKSGMFTTINNYLSTLPSNINEELYKYFFKINQDEIVVSYSDINNVLELEGDINRLISMLNFEHFKEWFKQNDQDIIYPPDLKDNFTFDPDMNTTEEKTYVRDEYKNLLALILFIRMLSPIYIKFFTYIKEVTPHYYYKLFTLFVKSDLYNSPELDKLKRYIETNQFTLTGNTNNKNEYHILNSGLSDDDMVDNLISTVIFSKLMSIDFTIKECNAVSYIFQTIKFKSNFTSQDGLVIRAKKTVNDPNKEDISYFEDYRKTSDITIGTIVELQHALSNMDFIVSTLASTGFDVELYNKELTMAGDFNEYRLDKVQIYLLGWFVNKVINPRALYYIEYRKLVELALFAKVTLLMNDQLFIASLFGSFKTNESGYLNIVIRNTIGKALLKRLSGSYNFSLSDTKQSVIEKTITETSKEITGYLWKPIGYTKSIESQINSDGYLTVPNNLNDIICDFIEFVNK